MSIVYPPTGNSIATPYGWVTIASRSERHFLQAWNARYGKSKLFHLYHQYEIKSGYRARVGNYRVDFANLLTKLAIEIDGSEHYRFDDIIMKDFERQTKIEARGWHFIRFPSWMVYRRTADCINEAASFITEQWELAVLREPQYHAGDKVYHRGCGEGIVVKSVIASDEALTVFEGACSLTTEFTTVRFRDRTLRLNMDRSELKKL